MWFLGNASTPPIRRAMACGRIGQMCTPAEGRAPLPGVVWAADNGCYAAGWPGPARWWAWLSRHTHAAPRCLFAAAPDIPGDAAATLAAAAAYLPAIRGLGYPAALVAQDGLETLAVPWEDFDVLFIGGTTSWKLSPAAACLARAALARGKTVHLGRVNSARRYAYARALGCASVDGTCLTYAPTTALARVLAWTRTGHPALEPEQEGAIP